MHHHLELQEQSQRAGQCGQSAGQQALKLRGIPRQELVSLCRRWLGMDHSPGHSRVLVSSSSGIGMAVMLLLDGA